MDPLHPPPAPPPLSPFPSPMVQAQLASFFAWLVLNVDGWTHVTLFSLSLSDIIHFSPPWISFRIALSCFDEQSTPSHPNYASSFLLSSFLSPLPVSSIESELPLCVSLINAVMETQVLQTPSKCHAFWIGIYGATTITHHGICCRWIEVCYEQRQEKIKNKKKRRSGNHSIAIFLF